MDRREIHDSIKARAGELVEGGARVDFVVDGMLVAAVSSLVFLRGPLHAAAILRDALDAVEACCAPQGRA